MSQSQRKKPKKSSSQSQIVDVDEEDGSAKNTQQSHKMSVEEMERKVQEMIRYILFSDRKKVGLKRVELVKNVLKEHSKAFQPVLVEVQLRIRDVFGYELVETTTVDGKGRGYILVNSIDKEFEDEISTLLDTDEESKHMGLLTIVLSLIFMNERPITEVALWHTLNKLGLYKERHSDVYGNVDKLLTQDFVKQNYLDRHKIQGADGPTWQYDFGSRSLKLVSKRSILRFVSDVYGVEAVEDWKSQYQHVLAEENAGSQPMDTSS